MGKVEAKGKEKKDFSSKEGDPITVVLKVEMHCEGCAKKVRRSVKEFKGVVAVTSDVTGNKLTVIGKVDPLELRNHLKSKTHQEVELISPAVSVKKEKDSSKAEGNKGAKDPKPDDKKPNEPSVTSVTLKVRLHCQGCIERIRKQINKIKGVEGVSIDSEKDLVMVKGSMDVNSLPGILTAKLKRRVEIVNPKKDGDGDKEKGEGQDAARTAPAAPAAMEGSKMENYGGWYVRYPYHFEMMHAPQLFSDENPNACSIM